MNIKGYAAMILAGGRGERLGALTRNNSKPAVYFCGNQRIIDFTLQNCKRSGIDNIGVLTQNYATDLNDYIRDVYNYTTQNGGVYILPPPNNENMYKGTANAVYMNIGFIDKLKPECVLVLASDHIYRMDYSKMIAFHMQTGADITVASTSVPIKEAAGFQIITASESGFVYDLNGKQTYSNSCLASMGIYIFKWSILKKYLLADNAIMQTSHDLAKDVLPKMLRSGELIYTCKFNGYWRDVGTVDSLWEANMDQINGYHSTLRLSDDTRKSPAHVSGAPYHVARESVLRHSIVSEGCSITGYVEHSVLGDQVTVDSGAEIVDSVVMPGAYIGRNVRIYKAIIGPEAIIMDNAVIGAEAGSDFFVDRKVCARAVSLVAPWVYVGEGMSFRAGSHIHGEQLQKHGAFLNAAEGAYHDQAGPGYENYAAHQAVAL